MELIIALLVLAGIFYLYKKKKKIAPVKTTADFKMGTDYAFGLGFPKMDALAAQVYLQVAKAGDIDAYAALGYMYSRGIHFKRDYEEAFQWYKLAADAGHATATFELSKFYIEGWGIPKDEQESVLLIKKAAQLGEPTAQKTLGNMYLVGAFGVSEDPKESLNWYMKSAKGNDSFAQCKVGDAYLDGKLLQRDTDKAMEYWNKSAENGSIEAMTNLRVFYQEGFPNMEPDLDRSLAWAFEAAKLGDTGNEYWVGSHFLTINDGDKNNNEAAAIWLGKAAEKGYADAEYALGVMYKRGLYFSVDADVAYEYFVKAAAQGHEEAWKELGLIDGLEESLEDIRPIADEIDPMRMAMQYYQGEGVPQDYSGAMKWCQLAATQGNALAMNMLGHMHQEGEGVEPDFAEAIKWHRMSAEKGDSCGQNMLGLAYAKGEGVEQDYLEALRWHRLSAAQGHAAAMFNLGCMYRKGQGVEKDCIRARMWYMLADSASDSGEAEYFLLVMNDEMTPEQIKAAEAMAQSCMNNGYQDCER